MYTRAQHYNLQKLLFLLKKIYILAFFTSFIYIYIVFYWSLKYRNLCIVKILI